MRSLRIVIMLFGFCLLADTVMVSCGGDDQGVPDLRTETGKMGSPAVKPFKVLVIIGDQWTDPLSYNIDTRRIRGEEFIDVVTMLKIWGVPFDILRLDEQRLQINRFLDGEAKPNYGCVIWMANPDVLEGYSAHYQTLKRAVEEYGISMIALFDNIKTKEVAQLVGVDYQGVTNIELSGTGEKLTISGDHFITKEAEGISLPDMSKWASASIPEANGISTEMVVADGDQEVISMVRCTASESVRVLGAIGENPQLVVRDISDETKVVWIGGGKDWFRRYPVMRGIFRKSLVYAMGYGLFNDNFENGFIFIMDDIGCSEHAWSLRWHYPTPSKETLMKYLIEPLEERGLMMVQNITPGYANPETKMIEDPWTVEPFTDIFGNWQDYGSTKAGLDEGLRRGVFEIQPHRAWSHMNWDLDSPPGPWWGSPVGGELALVDWYNEVVDVRRDAVPVPSNDLLFIYKTGIDAVKKSFGVVALSAEVRPGAELREGTQGGYDNGRVAAIAGLGVSRECYVGFDRTIEFSMMMPQQFTCHDLDLTERTNAQADVDDADWGLLLEMSTEELLASKIGGGRRINLLDNTDWIDSRMDKYWMGFNETCAYLHADISAGQKNTTGIEVSYDGHYCKYFEGKPSRWTLELSDEFLESLGDGTSVFVDGRNIKMKPASKQLIEITAGLGSHRIEILSKQ
jgi:hypothetical protein